MEWTTSLEMQRWASTGEFLPWPNTRCSRHSAAHAMVTAAGLCAGRCAAQVVGRS